MATNFSERIAVFLLFLAAVGVAGGTIDFDVDAELQRRGVDISFENLSANISNTSLDIETRSLIALAVGQADDPRAYDVLLSVMSSADPMMRAVAIAGLNRSQDPRVIQYLGSVLTDDQPDYVKQVAVTGLAKFGSKEARAALNVGARHANQDPYLKVAIIHYFDRSPDEESEQLMQVLVNDHDTVVRTYAALSLSRRFQGTYVASLVDAANDSTLPHYVWSDVVVRLEEISGQKFEQQQVPTHESEDPERRARVNEQIRSWWGEKRR